MRKLLFWFLLFPLSLWAQTNETDSLKLKAEVSLTGFWQTGNVNTVIFRTKADLTYKAHENWVFETKNSYLYQEFGKVKADEDILSLNFLSYKPQNRFFPLMIGIISSNFRREIAVRYIVGAGATFKAIEKDEDYLKFSMSFEYENTNFRKNDFNFDGYNGMSSINTVRNTIWLSGKTGLFKRKVITSLEAYFQPSVEDRNNFRWQADLSFELPISKRINFKVNYLHTYERIVIEGQEQEDRFLTFGLKWQSYGTLKK